MNAAQGDGMTALHWAVQHGDIELGNTIIYAGGDVHAGTRIGRYTPLHMAARSGDVGFVTLLLKANADPNRMTTNSGVTSLHLAAASGDPGVLTELIQAGATIDAKESSWGQTPLIFAAANNRIEAIRVLLSSGADPSITSGAVNVVEHSEADRAAERGLSEFLAEFKEKEGGGTDWQPRVKSKQQFWPTARFSENGPICPLLTQRKKRKMSRLKRTMNWRRSDQVLRMYLMLN